MGASEGGADTIYGTGITQRPLGSSTRDNNGAMTGARRRHGGAGADAISTVLVTGSTTPAMRAAPSRSTIAPVPPRPLGIAALLAMAMTDRELNDDSTQRLPEHMARSGAPCHTPAAFPPGFPTSAGRWKVPPEGRASTHEDENGATTAVVILTCAVRVSMCDVLHARHVVKSETKSACGCASENTLRRWSYLILLPSHLLPPASPAPVPLIRPPPPAPPCAHVVLSSIARPLPASFLLSVPLSLLPFCPGPKVSASAKLAAKRRRDTLTIAPSKLDSTFRRAYLRLGVTDVCAEHVGDSKVVETPVTSSMLLRPYAHHVVAYSLLVGAVDRVGSNDFLVAVGVRA